jgi:hypothetical protein
VLVSTEVAQNITDTVVMLGCIVETSPKALYISLITPDSHAKLRDDVLSNSIMCATTTSTQQYNTIEVENRQVQLVEITYDKDSFQSPFKLIDEVFGMFSSQIKKAGLYDDDDDDEKEYGFDDI